MAKCQICKEQLLSSEGNRCRDCYDEERDNALTQVEAVRLFASIHTNSECMDAVNIGSEINRILDNPDDYIWENRDRNKL